MISVEQLKELGIATEVVKLSDKTERTILTCIPGANGDGKYLIWPDTHSGRWRWALREWPDDDIGASNHGAAYTLEEVVQRCQQHHKRRAEIRDHLGR